MNGYLLKQLHADVESFKLMFVASEMHRLGKLDDESYYDVLLKEYSLIEESIRKEATPRISNMSPNEI